MIHDLLPCPFCGCELNNQDPLDTIYPADRERTIWQVVCQTCSATLLGDTPIDAVNNWNKRTKLLT